MPKDSSAEIRATAWIAFSGHGRTHYRIHNARTAYGMWQRHEWRFADGSKYAEDWIAVPYRDWASGAQPIAAMGAR